MLEKMGWKRGDGLGKQGKGMKDPVRLFEKSKGGSFSNERVIFFSIVRLGGNWFTSSSFLFSFQFFSATQDPAQGQEIKVGSGSRCRRFRGRRRTPRPIQV